LHGKFKLGLISNLAIPECVWKRLEKFDLKHFFNTIIISGEINRRKPSAEIFQRALKNLGVEASEALFVGDMPGLDVMGSKRVGMKAIIILRIIHPYLFGRKRLEAEYIITHGTEVPLEIVAEFREMFKAKKEILLPEKRPVYRTDPIPIPKEPIA